jgi:hypothetical protein
MACLPCNISGEFWQNSDNGLIAFCLTMPSDPHMAGAVGDATADRKVTDRTHTVIARFHGSTRPCAAGAQATRRQTAVYEHGGRLLGEVRVG